MSNESKSIVVVGHGMVSHRLCELLVANGLHACCRITVLGEEAIPAYDRVHLGRLFCATGDGHERNARSTVEWYREHGLHLSLNDPACSIDREARLVIQESGRAHPYDQLVLATGARARVPNVEGLDDGVLLYRTLEDVFKLRAAASCGRRVAILGGGLLGLECADSLRQLGCDVTVYEASQTLLPRQLDAQSAGLLRTLVRRRGIGVETGYRLIRVGRTEDGGYNLFAAGRDVVDCDVLVAAVGVRPEDSLARSAGLTCAAAGGVSVSENLASSDPHIYAIGDCAAYRGSVPGLVAPGYEMASVLAARLAGDDARAYGGARNDCRLKLAGIDVLTLGRYDMEAVHHRYLSTDAARTIVVSHGRLVGATIVGEYDESALLQRAVDEQRSLSDRDLLRFERQGRLGLAGRSLPVLEWPRSAMVCQCAKVTRGALADLIAQGAQDVATLQARSRAGTVCGSCAPLLSALSGTYCEPVSLRYAKLTGVSSALLLVCVLCFVFLPGLPASLSVRQASYTVEALWRSSLFRQTSGFIVVALFTIGLLLSVRKRLGWLSQGSFAGYRALHTCLGLLSATALCAHTGLRLGSHLNFALSLIFILAALLGAGAGVASAFEGGSKAVWARSARATLSRVHLWLLWPLPALLAFHILAAYYF